MRAVFTTPEPAVDGIDFVLTPRERDFVAWARVHIERQRRERNAMDDARGVSAELHRLGGETE